MTAPWSGSEEADGDEELAEGVGSADAVASGVGAAEGGRGGAGRVADSGLLARQGGRRCPSEGGNDHEDGQERPDVLPLGRLGAVHADGHIFAGAVKFIPGVLRTHAFRLSEKREWGAGGARGM